MTISKIQPCLKCGKPLPSCICFATPKPTPAEAMLARHEAGMNALMGSIQSLAKGIEVLSAQQAGLEARLQALEKDDEPLSYGPMEGKSLLKINEEVNRTLDCAPFKEREDEDGREDSGTTEQSVSEGAGD